MFQDFSNKNQPNQRSKGRVETKQIDPNILKPLTQIVDQTIFQQNLAQLEKEFGLKKLDPTSQTFKDLRHYVHILLTYPSTSLAKLHRQSHRLGNFDVASFQAKSQNSSQAQQMLIVPFSVNPQLKELDNCPCCGLQRQQSELKMCSTSFAQMQMVGISTFMFFRTMRNLLYFLILILIVFGIYAFATNIKSSNIWKDEGKQDLFKNMIFISLGSKIYLTVQQDYIDLLVWQVWLGFVMVILFMIAYMFIQHLEVKEIQQVEEKTKTVADFSIVIKGVPVDVKQQEIQKNLNDIFKRKKTTVKRALQYVLESKGLKIAKINIASPINLQKDLKKKKKNELSIIEAEITQLCQQIISWISELKSSTEFVTSPQERRKVEESYLQKLKERNQKIIQIVNEVKKHYHTGNVRYLTDCFVTFQSSKGKNLVLDSLSYSPIDKFLQYLTLSIYKKTTSMRFGAQGSQQVYNVKILQAPQPQDLIWQNIGLNTMSLFARKCVTFLFTFVILGASFAAVYGLSTIQVNNQENRYISFLISICIVLFNYIITIVLTIFTSFELNSSHTDYQCSYAVKAIIAQLINTIIIPILVNRFLKKENYIYTTSGLADDIFLLGLSNAFITPLIKIFDGYYFFVKYVMVWYYDRPGKKFFMNQIQLNKVYQLMLFEGGIEYIYVITLYLWTCFFMSLQPIIIAFSIFGYIFNYWAQKYSLFHRCKRPVPGTRILYDTMVQFVYAGGFFYAMGSLSFINLIPKDIFKSELNFALIANILAICFSAISLFIPYSYLYEIWFNSNSDTKQRFYEKQRILFPSQYDRSNPITSDKALGDYFEYVNKKKEQYQHRLHNNESDQEMQQMFNTLANQSRNFYTQYQQSISPYFTSWGNSLSNLFRPNVEVIQPKDIQTFLIADIIKDSLIVEKEQMSSSASSSHKGENQRKNDKGDSIIKVALKKGASLFKKNDDKNNKKDEEIDANRNNHQSLERLSENDDGIINGNRKIAKKRGLDVKPQVNQQQNGPGDLWQIVGNNIHNKVTNLSDPLKNHVTYSTSPYNSQALQDFKQKTSQLYVSPTIQSQIRKSGVKK